MHHFDTLTGKYRHVWSASHLQESTSIHFPFSLSAMRTARAVLAGTNKNENKRFYGSREANILHDKNPFVRQID